MKLTKQLTQLLDNLQSQQWIELLSKKYNIYIVGGCVRDGFLNKPIKDVDIVIENISLNSLVFDLELFGKVDLVGESFSVIKFRPFGHEGEDFDIAVPRTDRKISEGHK
jgi:tRNA nucleotidyltransferase (CCA-adding enzyme)